jgi:competence protein ComEC
LTNHWRNIPVLRMLFPFLTGVFAQIQMELPINFWLVGAIFFCVLASLFSFWKALKFSHPLLFGAIIGLFYISLGGALCQLRTPLSNPAHFGHLPSSDYLDAVISSVPEKGKNSYKTKAIVQAVFIEGNIYKTNGEILLYITEASNVLVNKGDRVMLLVNPTFIEGPQNPDEFNYRRYLYFHGLYHRVMISDEDQLVVLQRNYRKWWIDPFERLRILLVSKLRQALKDDNSFAVGSALILGQKNYLSPEIRQAYSSSGAMHVLAVSGLHVGIIYVIIIWVVSFIRGFKGDTFVRVMIVLMILWSYASITGLSASVLRACTMFSVVAISQIIGRKSGIYNSLSAAALLLLCFNPFMITEVGFQLSFAAVLGIVLMQSPLYNLLQINNKLLDKVWQITCVSLAAQLVTFPMGVLYFHQFPNYFILSNLIVIPAAFLVLVIGLAVLAVQFINPLFQLLGELLNWLLLALNYAVVYVEQLPYSLSSGLFFSIFEVWMVYLIIAFLILFVLKKDVIALIVIAGCTLLLLVSFTTRVADRRYYRTIVVNNIKGSLSINFLDGERNILLGDSALINNDARQIFHLKNYWYRLGFSEAERIDIKDSSIVNLPGFYRKDGFVNFHGFKIYVASERQNQTEKFTPPDIDWLVLSGKTRHEDYPGTIGEIVVSSGYRYRRICCTDSLPQFIDVRKEGALLRIIN